MWQLEAKSTACLYQESILFSYRKKSYDMVIRKEDFTKKPYQKMIEIIRSPEYQKEVAGLGSYNVENMGKNYLF